MGSDERRVGWGRAEDRVRSLRTLAPEGFREEEEGNCLQGKELCPRWEEGPPGIGCAGRAISR